MKKSKTSHAVLDIKSRKEKAALIIGILKNYKNLKKCKILDIGTGSGVISSELGKASKKACSVDVADERIEKSHYDFKKIRDENLPFKDNEFDVVVSNHVMAHTKNDEMHLKEINRVMKKDGIAYLSMLNRLWPLEPNFSLLFLSWLPNKIADSYVRISGKGKCYNVHPLTYHKFTKKIKKYFVFDDLTSRIISNKIWMPKPAYSLLKFFSPVWIMVLKKR
ncbi:class I SAM-dependent methyltransferase [Candidatus Woesearchaeota archaeon]|nr:class I SAM-dependent methyltransferase [Candidatus Woesearchaeota archaeon]